MFTCCACPLSTENEGSNKLEITVFYSSLISITHAHSATLQLPFDFYIGKSNMGLLHESSCNISILCVEELKPNLFYISVLNVTFLNTEK